MNKIKDSFGNIYKKMNISYHIAEHLLGEKHNHIHRKAIGIVIMIFGVTLVKLSSTTKSEIIHMCGDIIGYGFHGLGLMPFVYSIEKKIKKETKTVLVPKRETQQLKKFPLRKKFRKKKQRNNKLNKTKRKL